MSKKKTKNNSSFSSGSVSTSGLKTMEGIVDVTLYNNDNQPYPTSRVIKRDSNGNVVVEEIIEEPLKERAQNTTSALLSANSGSSKLYDSHWESLSPAEKKNILRIQKEDVFEVLKIFQHDENSSNEDTSADSAPHNSHENATPSSNNEHTSSANANGKTNTVCNNHSHHNSNNKLNTPCCTCCGRRNVGIEEDLQDIYNYLYIQEKIKQPDLSHVLFHLNLVKDINNKISTTGVINQANSATTHSTKLKNAENVNSIQAQHEQDLALPPPSYNSSIVNGAQEDESSPNQDTEYNQIFETYRHKFEDFAKDFISGHHQINEEFTDKVLQFPQLEMLAQDLCDNGGKAFLKQVELNKKNNNPPDFSSEDIEDASSKPQPQAGEAVGDLSFNQFSFILNTLGEKVDQNEFGSHLLNDDAKNILKNLRMKIEENGQVAQSEIKKENHDELESKNYTGDVSEPNFNDISIEITQEDLSKLNLQEQLKTMGSDSLSFLNDAMAHYNGKASFGKHPQIREEEEDNDEEYGSDEYYDDEDAEHQDYYDEDEEFDEEDDQKEFFESEEDYNTNDHDHHRHHMHHNSYNGKEHENQTLGDDDTEIDEEKRIEEGKKLIQIAITKILQKKLVSSYKEKQAETSRLTLLEELEREETKKKEREEKKAKKREKEKERKKQVQASREKELEQLKIAQEQEKKEAEEKELKRREEQRKKVEEIKRKKDELMRKKIEDQRKREEEEAKQKKLKEETRKKKEEERKQKELEKKLEKERRLEEQKKKLDEKLEKEKQAQEQLEREAEIEKQKQSMLEKLKESADASFKQVAFPYGMQQSEQNSFATSGDLLQLLQKPRTASTSLSPSSQQASLEPTSLNLNQTFNSCNDSLVSPLLSSNTLPDTSRKNSVFGILNANNTMSSSQSNDVNPSTNISPSMTNGNVLNTFYTPPNASIMAQRVSDTSGLSNIESMNYTPGYDAQSIRDARAFMTPTDLNVNLDRSINNGNELYSIYANNILSGVNDMSLKDTALEMQPKNSMNNMCNTAEPSFIESDSSANIGGMNRDASMSTQFSTKLPETRNSIWSENVVHNSVARSSLSGPSTPSTNHTMGLSTNQGPDYLTPSICNAYMQISACGNNDKHLPIDNLFQFVSTSLIGSENQCTYSVFIKHILNMCSTHGFQLLTDDKGTITHVWWNTETGRESGVFQKKNVSYPEQQQQQQTNSFGNNFYTDKFESLDMLSGMSGMNMGGDMRIGGLNNNMNNRGNMNGMLGSGNNMMNPMGQSSLYNGMSYNSMATQGNVFNRNVDAQNLPLNSATTGATSASATPATSSTTTTSAQNSAYPFGVKSNIWG